MNTIKEVTDLYEHRFQEAIKDQNYNEISALREESNEEIAKVNNVEDEDIEFIQQKCNSTIERIVKMAVIG